MRTLEGKVAVVTGANSGMGKVTARALAELGAHVVCVCRDRTRGEAAVAEIRIASGNPDVVLMPCDLSSQKSIHEFVDAFKQTHQAIHVLVNNAGVINPHRFVTEDGYEATFALNHLGYFLLTELLLDLLKAGAPSRVVNIASEASERGHIDFDDLQKQKKYSAFSAYAMSKLANIMFTFDLAERLRGTGVTVNAVHPGPVATGFGKEFKGVMGWGMKLAKPFMRSAEQGADTAIYLATSPEVEGVTGQYFADRKPIRAKAEAYDPAVRAKLWETSERLTGRAHPRA